MIYKCYWVFTCSPPPVIVEPRLHGVGHQAVVLVQALDSDQVTTVQVALGPGIRPGLDIV